MNNSKMKNSANSSDINTNILCDVTNCTYNNDGQACVAPVIKVGPQYAACSSDTICSTFQPE